MIADHKVQIAVTLIDNSGIADLLESAVRTDRRGRPRRCPIRTFLIGALLAAQTPGHLTIRNIHQVLTTQISRTWQHDLDVLRRIGDRVQPLTERALYGINMLLAAKLDHTTASAPDLDAEERTRRHDLLQQVSDQLLDVTLISCSSTVRAIDSSGLWAWAIAPRAPRHITAIDGATPDPDDDQDWRDSPADTRLTNDPDAAWGVKTRKDGKQQAYFGYELHASVRVPQTTDDIPVQVERLAITSANDELTGPTLSLFDRAIAAGNTITEVIGDRHYSYKRTETWADELRRRNISQHLDLRSSDHGFSDLNGMRVAAGRAHCPATPDRLATIPHPGLNPAPGQHTAFDALIAERQAYAMRRVQRPNAKGRTRLECPAITGTIGCPLREGSVAAADALGLPVVINPPDLTTAPRACTQRTVAITQPTLNKYDQPHYWGSPTWKATYARRTYVEGFFGSLKDPATENVSRGFIRTTGLARMTLYVTIATAATNIRHLQRWHERTGNGPPSHPALNPAPTSYGFAELTPDQAHEIDATRAA